MRRRAVAALAVLLLAGAGLLVAGPAQAATGGITGTVSIDGATPVPSGNVVLLPTNLTGAAVAQATIGSGGSYTMSGIAPGSYELLAGSTVSSTDYAYLGAVSVTSGLTTTRNVPVIATFDCHQSLAGRANVGQTLAITTAPTPAEPHQIAGKVIWNQLNAGSGGTWTYGIQLPDTGTTHVLTDADLGHEIVFSTVTWNQANGRVGFGATSATQGARLVGPRLPALSGLPSVSGAHKVGKTLSASAPVETGATAAYQWFRLVKRKHHLVSSAIGGATGPTYKPKRKDVGKKVFVRVSAVGSAYAASTQDSVPVKVRR